MSEKITCRTCDVEKMETEFYYNRFTGNFTLDCKPCVIKRRKNPKPITLKQELRLLKGENAKLKERIADYEARIERLKEERQSYMSIGQEYDSGATDAFETAIAIMTGEGEGWLSMVIIIMK